MFRSISIVVFAALSGCAASDTQASNASAARFARAEAAEAARATYFEAEKTRQIEQETYKLKIKEAQERPSPAAREFENRLRPFDQDLGIATQAQRCGLRSQDWLNTYGYGVLSVRKYGVEQLKLSQSDQTVVGLYANETRRAFTNKYTCDQLFRHSALDRIDRQEREFNAGYY